MRNNNKFKRFFSNPLVGVIGSAASIISLIFAITVFLSSKSNRELSFYIHPIKTTIAKIGQASRLAVSFDGKEINNDITAVQISFWNRGKQVIKKDEIFKPILIYTEDRSPILEARIMNTTREIVGVTIDTANLNKGQVGVSWKILENGDGFAIQLIYEGTQETQFKIHGIIEGQKTISEYDNPIKIKTAQEQYKLRRSWGYGIILSVIMSLVGIYILIIVLIEIIKKDFHSLLKFNFIFKILLALFFLYGGIDLFISVLKKGPGPPFGF